MTDYVRTQCSSEARSTHQRAQRTPHTNVRSIMAPRKGPQAKVPRPIQTIRSILKKADGQAITVDDIESLPHKERNAAFSCLTSALKANFPEAHNKYRQLQNDRKRREWLATFTLGPATGGCVGQQTTTVSTEKATHEQEVWITEEDVLV